MDNRHEILETLIEIAIFDGTYETHAVGVTAHCLLTGQTKEEFRKLNLSLKELYPQLVRPPTDSEKYWKELSEGKSKPIAIWNKKDAEAYYKATEEERAAWNEYAQCEADKFQDTLDAYETVAGHIGRDRDGNITNWCPPLFFPEWLESRKK